MYTCWTLLLLTALMVSSCLFGGKVCSVCVGKVKLHYATALSDLLEKDENQQWMIQKQQTHFCGKRFQIKLN